MLLTSISRYNFNPRPREEGDHRRYGVSRARMNFNPRPREEGDQKRDRLRSSSLDFNPRPREEGDIECMSYNLSEQVFQSTPS